jgi:alpha,alpha-trehalase
MSDFPFSRQRLDAVLFDLDGVLTATAKVHAACWKKMFDDFLARRAEHGGERFVPFDIDSDYKRYVDGKPRYDGVSSFLESRGIRLPYGRPDDPVDRETVCGLGNRKSEMVVVALETEGVESYEGSVALVKLLRREGFKTAVVSSSNNCEAVLKSAGIAELFDVRVDGLVAARLELPGKPAPDTFVEAARKLGVEPARAAVVEDAIAGVEAGRDGGFGLVVGVDREGAPQTLREHGAHIVVADLGELLP